jgi:hypothetical protein
VCRVAQCRERSLPDGFSEIAYAAQPAGDLRGVTVVPLSNSFLESVETGLFVVDQSTTLLAIIGIQGSDEAAMGVHRSL